jgi:hypothetical protein
MLGSRHMDSTLLDMVLVLEMVLGTEWIPTMMSRENNNKISDIM